MTVRHKDWTGLESGCSFTSVRTKFDPNIARNTKTMGVNVAHVSARCSGEGYSWRSDFVLYFSRACSTCAVATERKSATVNQIGTGRPCA